MRRQQSGREVISGTVNYRVLPALGSNETNWRLVIVARKIFLELSKCSVRKTAAMGCTEQEKSPFNIFFTSSLQCEKANLKTYSQSWFPRKDIVFYH